MRVNQGLPISITFYICKLPNTGVKSDRFDLMIIEFNYDIHHRRRRTKYEDLHNADDPAEITLPLNVSRNPLMQLRGMRVPHSAKESLNVKG